MKNEGVVLVHGLWLVGWTLRPLAGYLDKAGFTTCSESYNSVFRSPEENARAVLHTIRAMGCDTVHLVGHSLGGLVALTALAQDSELPPGRVVLLGTPLNGSAAARTFAHLPGGDWLLGQGKRLLSEGLEHTVPNREIGLIAGNLPLGVGAPIAGLTKPHDGTIAVAETRHPDLTDHRVLPVSHMSMLLSGQVNEQVVHFIRNARFKYQG